MTLEVNASRTKFRDFIEKIVRAKLGMNLPIVMQGTSLLYEVGDDLDEDEIRNYEANLEKVVAPLICLSFINIYIVVFETLILWLPPGAFQASISSHWWYTRHS